MKKIYEKFFSREKIREIFKKTHKNYFSFIFDVIISASPETALEVSKYLENLFENEKLELRKILSHRDEDWESIFSFFKDKKESEKELKIFVELLRKTFDENQTEEFVIFFKFLKFKSKLFSNFENFADFDNIRSFDWSEDDFEFFIENFNEIKEYYGVKNLRNILKGKNYQGWTLLDEIVFNDANENFIQSFLQKILKVLNKTEILSLIFAQERGTKETSLMWAASLRKLKELKVFWDFVDENLNEDEKLKILLMETRFLTTALQSSTWNKDPNSFLFIKEIYEKFFSQEKIREIFKKTHKNYFPFVYYVIYYASPETALEVSKYLENLFKNEKIELRKILSQRHLDGDSILSYLKDKKQCEEKLKIFIELLRKTFLSNQEKEFEDCLKALHLRFNLLEAKDFH
jgi:hypothetical protein